MVAISYQMVMEALKKNKEKKEEELHKEVAKAEELDLAISRTLVLPHKPCTWLMIIGWDYYQQHFFYSKTGNQLFSQFVLELQKTKYVAFWYGEWLVLRDTSTHDCSLLNILTMEKLQLPPLYPHLNLDGNNTNCAMSSSKMDRSCRVIFVEKHSGKFKSCHVGDSEYLEGEFEGEFMDQDWNIRDLINFKGKLYALTTPSLNLIASDFSDPDLHQEQVVSGESLIEIYSDDYQRENEIRLVEFCENLLLIYIPNYDEEVSRVNIFKADFSIGEWVELETLGDRALFLGSVNNTFSSQASAIGMKGNAVYWVRSLSKDKPKGQLYMYDIEDKSISVSSLVSNEGTFSYLSWVSFPLTCHEEKKPEQMSKSSLLEAFPIETNFHVHRENATAESTELQIELRQPQKIEDIKTIGSNLVKKESLWADLPYDLLLQIFPHLLAGDRVAFRSVCRSWYSISPSSRSSQQCVLPLKSSDQYSPVLMCKDNITYNPISSELQSMDFPHIPGAEVLAARDGWLLMSIYSTDLCFYNPFTKEEIPLPDCEDAIHYYSVCFSAPPTSADCLVIAVIGTDDGRAVCSMKFGDENWSSHKMPQDFYLLVSSSTAVVYKGLYYFLLHLGETLIFDPKKRDHIVTKTPTFLFKLKLSDKQYMLESDDGRLIAVFVSIDGSSVYTCQWNMSTSNWEILESLENMMLFVSCPLSVCKRATVSGTGNKIYFPRVVSDNGHILFYSLATRKFHTFEMGTSYPNFHGSKIYTPHNTWFMP